MMTATSYGERELRVHFADSDPDSGWLFHFGAYGDTHVAILGCGLSLEDALEEAFEWLDDNAPGLLSRCDYEGAAKDLGLGPDWADSETAIEQVTSAAETDMTMCGHTTLKNGDCIPSWEWSVTEIGPTDLAQLIAEQEAREDESEADCTGGIAAEDE